jgi:hypothetical protein
MDVDDEGKYFNTLTALSDNSYDTDLAASSDSDPEYDPEGDIVDEDDGDNVPVFSYDADDPCIDVAVVFQNIDEWDDSYTLLPTYQVELMKSMPSSVVEMDTEVHNGDVCFRRFFVALKPCIDGFLQGCMPYIAMDSSHLIGRSRG